MAQCMIRGAHRHVVHPAQRVIIGGNWDPVCGEEGGESREQREREREQRGREQRPGVQNICNIAANQAIIEKMFFFKCFTKLTRDRQRYK